MTKEQKPFSVRDMKREKTDGADKMYPVGFLRKVEKVDFCKSDGNRSDVKENQEL